jgi:hypothetical protein
MVQLGLGGANPTHEYVEAWLGRKETEAANLAEHRHKETLAPARKGARWAFGAFLVGAAAAVLSLIALFKYRRGQGMLVLAHKVGSKVEQAYRRTDQFQKRRQLADLWARFCSSSSAPAGRVVAIRR